MTVNRDTKGIMGGFRAMLDSVRDDFRAKIDDKGSAYIPGEPAHSTLPYGSDYTNEKFDYAGDPNLKNK